MERLDYKGLSCPQPVLNIRTFLLEHPESTAFCVLVDNLASAENVKRFLENQGFKTQIQGSGTEIEVSARQTCQIVGTTEETSHSDTFKTAVLIVHDVMGDGDRNLGTALMQNFLKTLPEMADSLWRIIFLNSGVKLTVEGAETLPALIRLAELGVHILVCGTCLNHFQLLEKKRVGETTNMLDVVTSLHVAQKVITI